MGRNLNFDQAQALIATVDACGLDSVLMTLSEMCGLRAVDAAEHQHDTTNAKRWAEIEGALGVLVPKAHGL